MGKCQQFEQLVGNQLADGQHLTDVIDEQCSARPRRIPCLTGANFRYRLKPLRPLTIPLKQTPIKIIAWDIETFSDINGKFHPYCVCTSEGNVYWGTNCTEQFIDDVLKRASRYGERTYYRVVYISHNGGGFDHLLVIKDLIQRSESASPLMFRGKIYGINAGVIRFRDSYMLFPTSLREFCRAMNTRTQKGEFDHGRVNETNYHQFRQEAVEYCYRDCMSLLEAYQKYRQLIYQLARVDIASCYSLAGACVKAFRTLSYPGDVMAVSASPFQQECIRSSYHGGMTRVFNTGRLRGEYVYHDINSSYPSIMTGPVPTKAITDRIVINEEITEFVDTNLYRVKRIEFPPGTLVNLPVPQTPKPTEYPTVQENRWRWGVELNTSLRGGVPREMIIVDAVIEFEAQSIFKEYIEKFYNIRIEAKTDPENQEKQTMSTVAKLYINSLYGKFGQRIDTKTVIVDVDELGDYIAEEDVVSYSKITDNNLVLTYNIDTSEQNDTIGSLVHIASYITAAGRSKLCRYIQDIGLDNVIYCDTDSVIFRRDALANVVGQQDNIKLGYWKDELGGDIITDLTVIAPKLYGFRTMNGKEVVKMRGIRSALVDNNYDLLCKLAEGYNLKFMMSDCFIKENYTGISSRTIWRTIEGLGNIVGEIEISNNWCKAT